MRCPRCETSGSLDEGQRRPDLHRPIFILLILGVSQRRDGKLSAFRPGVDRILKTDPVPVYMLAINGLWGSFFSRMGGRAMSRIPHPSRRIISVVIQRFQDSSENKTDAIAPVLQKEMANLLE